MKAIINNSITYKVTGERGDFLITEDNKGKMKMFAKHLVEVIEIEEMPKSKVFKSKPSNKLATKLSITASLNGAPIFASQAEREAFEDKREAAKRCSHSTFY